MQTIDIDDTSGIVARTRKIVGALNHLIASSIDDEKAYSLAAADAREPALKKLLLGFAEERAAFVLELQAAVERLHATAANDGTAFGTIHRIWVDVRKTFEGRSDRLVLEECVVGEESSRARYGRWLRELVAAGCSADVRAVVEKQLARIDSALELLKEHLSGGAPRAAAE